MTCSVVTRIVHSVNKCAVQTGVQVFFCITNIQTFAFLSCKKAVTKKTGGQNPTEHLSFIVLALSCKQCLNLLIHLSAPAFKQFLAFPLTCKCSASCKLENSYKNIIFHIVCEVATGPGNRTNQNVHWGIFKTATTSNKSVLQSKKLKFLRCFFFHLLKLKKVGYLYICFDLTPFFN